jgi:hypothetical protein
MNAQAAEGAVATARQVLEVFCSGCGTSRALDLRNLDRHPLAPVGTLVLRLRERGATHAAYRDPRDHELLPDAVSVNVGLDCDCTPSHTIYVVESTY